LISEKKNNNNGKGEGGKERFKRGVSQSEIKTGRMKDPGDSWGDRLGTVTTQKGDWGDGLQELSVAGYTHETKHSGPWPRRWERGEGSEIYYKKKKNRP